MAQWLRDQQHDVLSAYEGAQGAQDELLLQKACAENRILITNDKDFGEKVFRDKLPHKGAIFLRLSDERTPKKIAVLEKVLRTYPNELTDRFVVATETVVRIVKVRRESLRFEEHSLRHLRAPALQRRAEDAGVDAAGTQMRGDREPIRAGSDDGDV